MSRKHIVTAVVALAVGIVTGVSGTAWGVQIARAGPRRASR